jgi:hypothetical protein
VRTRQRLILDTLIACGLMAAYRPSWTGITLHEWVSAAIAVPLIVHLVVNWEWCLRIARTFFDRLFHASRANFVVDVGLLVSSVSVMLSGVMVSPVPGWFGIQPAQLMLWARLHLLSADAIIALFVVHTVLHRRWIASAAKRLFAGEGSAAGARSIRARGAVPARVAARPALTPTQTRRAARLAAEKAAARRRASVGGVLGVGVAIASLIFASVAIAGPSLAGSHASSAPAVAAVATAAVTKPAASTVATKSVAAAPAMASFATMPTSKAIAAKPVAAKPAAAKKVAVNPAAAVKQTCPRTGCAAYSCHGASGANPNTWYQTHK